MRNLILSFLFILFIQCKEPEKKSIDCETREKIEQAIICLPNLKGLANIANDNDYKSFIEQFKSVGNHIIGFYIDTTSLDYTEKRNYNYASIYVSNQLTKDINTTAFKKISKTMGSYFSKEENLKKVIEDVEQNYLENISLEIPIIIDSYSFDNEIKTYLLLGKTIESKREIVTLTTLNLLHVQNKMVLVSYILKYKNKNSIDKIKQKNDYIVMRLLKANE